METTKIIAAGVLPICPSTGRALLSKRHPHVMYGNTWASWGGKFEDVLGDKTPQDCAKREFWEETRIEVSYHFVEDPVHVYEDERVIYYTFIGLFEEEVDADIITEGGLADQKWFSLDGFPEDLMPEFKVMLEAEMEKLKVMTAEAVMELPHRAYHYPFKVSAIYSTETDFTHKEIDLTKVDLKKLLASGNPNKPKIRVVSPEEFFKPDNDGE